MEAAATQIADSQPVVAQLRESTRQLHLAPHEHPLFVELFARPSFDCYRVVLDGFLRFYAPSEPSFVECAKTIGEPKLYARPVRTEWLKADLEALGYVDRRAAIPTGTHVLPQPADIGELLGCLSVVSGSALGGQSILKQLRPDLALHHCSRFFHGDGERTA